MGRPLRANSQGIELFAGVCLFSSAFREVKPTLWTPPHPITTTRHQCIFWFLNKATPFHSLSGKLRESVGRASTHAEAGSGSVTPVVPVGLRQSFYHSKYVTKMTEEESYSLKESRGHPTLLKNSLTPPLNPVPAQNKAVMAPTQSGTVGDCPCARGKDTAVYQLMLMMKAEF